MLLAPVLPRAPPPMAVLPAADPWNVYAVLAAAGAGGRALGGTTIGAALSGPICAMALTFCFAAAGVLPAASPAVAEAQHAAVRIATPLLLLDADLRAVWRRAGRQLPTFVLGSLGSTLGAAAGLLVCRSALSAAFGAADALKLAAALFAKNVGGGLNFVAVASALQLHPSAFSAALAADNIMALVYFPSCSWLSRGQPDVCPEQQQVNTTAAAALKSVPIELALAQGIALAVALLTVAVSRAWAARVAPGFELPLSTCLAVGLATTAPRLCAPLAEAGAQLGSTALFFFFASAGWTGGALRSALLSGGPPLLAFLLILYIGHFALVLGAGAAARRLWPESTLVRRCLQPSQLLVGSNANIGGPATASALALGNGWHSLVTPALLVGNLGTAIATPAALLLHALLRDRLLGTA